MKKRYLLRIVGKSGEAWPFEVLVNPNDIQQYRDDGIEIYELYNTIPEILWRGFLDIVRFRNPFG